MVITTAPIYQACDTKFLKIALKGVLKDNLQAELHFYSTVLFKLLRMALGRLLLHTLQQALAPLPSAVLLLKIRASCSAFYKEKGLLSN